MDNMELIMLGDDVERDFTQWWEGEARDRLMHLGYGEVHRIQELLRTAWKNGAYKVIQGLEVQQGG